jgi:hypothetical protein
MKPRGMTLIETVTATGLTIVVASLVGVLYMTVGRAIQVERARSEMLVGSREVMHYLRTDTHRATGMSVTPDRLTLNVAGERISYSNSANGVARQTGQGARMLGNTGMQASFQPAGGRGVEVVLTQARQVRSRNLRLQRQCTFVRRQS